MKGYHHWQAWALIALGAWLTASPLFVEGFVPDSPARVLTQLAGLAAILLGFGGFVHARSIDRWIDLALGLGDQKRPTSPRPFP